MSNTLVDQYALDTILTDSAELDYDYIISKLEEGEIPEDVIVWQPFESYDPKYLASILDDVREGYRCFAEDIIKAMN